LEKVVIIRDTFTVISIIKNPKKENPQTFCALAFVFKKFGWLRAKVVG
jgi:hypothetical protein